MTTDIFLRSPFLCTLAQHLERLIRKPACISSFRARGEFKPCKFQCMSSPNPIYYKANLFSSLCLAQATPDLLVQTLLFSGVPFVSNKLSYSLGVWKIISLNIRCKIGRRSIPTLWSDQKLICVAVRTIFRL